MTGPILNVGRRLTTPNPRRPASTPSNIRRVSLFKSLAHAISVSRAKPRSIGDGYNDKLAKKGKGEQKALST